MHTLFNPENKFWIFIGKIADVTCMSLLWLITSLPIITIGASTAAFYSFTMDAIQDLEGGVWNSYFRAFRKNFKKATLIWVLQLILFIFLAVNLYAAWKLYLAKGLIALGILSLAASGMLLLIGTGVYLYPITVSYDFPIKKVISDSLVMAIRNPHVTVSCIVLYFLASVAIYYFSGFFFFWIGLTIFFSSYFVLGVFMKYSGVIISKKKKRQKKIDPYI